jgi:hypothetical protein
MIDVYDIRGDKKLAIKYTADRAILIGLQHDKARFKSDCEMTAYGSIYA